MCLSSDVSDGNDQSEDFETALQTLKVLTEKVNMIIVQAGGQVSMGEWLGCH